MINILLLLFFLGALFFIISKKENFCQKKETDCICVFDLDGTITCGLDNAADAISICKEKNCKIAINTARSIKWYDDINFDKLGLDKNDFENDDSDFYHGEQFVCSFGNIKCFEDTISQTKVKHLNTLANKWNVDPKRIILFDDQYANIEKAKHHGFSTIFANHHVCGLPDNTIQQIISILN